MDLAKYAVTAVLAEGHSLRDVAASTGGQWRPALGRIAELRLQRCNDPGRCRYCFVVTTVALLEVVDVFMMTCTLARVLR